MRGEYGTKAYESYSAEAPARSTRDDTPAADLGRTLPMTVRSNLYLNGAAPWSHEKDARVMTDRPVRLAVVKPRGITGWKPTWPPLPPTRWASL